MKTRLGGLLRHCGLGLSVFFLVSARASANELHDAVRRGDASSVEALLKTNPAAINLPGADAQASLPIHLAAQRNDTNMLALLLRAGAKLDATNGWGATALHSAALWGSGGAARWLVEHGAPIGACGFALGQTPLHCAAEKGSADTVELLLAHGADIEAADLVHSTPLHYAAKEGHDAAVEVLLAHHANLEAKGDYQATPLISAASRGWTNVARTLLENKANVNAQTENGYSALSQSARYGHLGMVELLLTYQPNVELEDNTGRTPLGWALENDSGKPHDNIAALLRRHGASKLTTGVKRTSIHEAASEGDLERVKTLLGQQPEMIDKKEPLFDKTPLHEAASCGRAGVCEFLLKKGAEVNAKDVVEATPLHLAAKGGYLAVVELLLANNANPQAADEQGRTVLHYAVFGRNTRVIELLLRQKVDRKAKDKRGSTALDYATALGIREAAQILKQ